MSEDMIIFLFMVGAIGGNLYFVSIVYRFTKWMLSVYAENYIKEKSRKHD